jgi:Papain-like cysteine protease AvrRpt2
VTRSTRRAHRRLRRFVVGALLVGVVGGTLTTLAIATDTFGAGERWITVVSKLERLIAGPVPDRATLKTVLVTEPPAFEVSPEPTEAPAVQVPGGSAAPSAEPAPTPTPRPERKPMDVDIVQRPNRVFASQHHKDWCAPAGVQTVLAILGKSDTSDQTQIEIASQVRKWEAWEDSHNGDWGPAAMALALDAYGAPGYEVRAFEHMTYALRDAAVAIQSTQSPAILLAWRGAHTWVMTGYRADGDPAIFRNTKIEGAYILDPWYPRISSIWGPSNPPGIFTEFDELRENFLPWKRPEGRYADRDGLYITVVPTIPRAAAG